MRIHPRIRTAWTYIDERVIPILIRVLLVVALGAFVLAVWMTASPVVAPLIVDIIQTMVRSWRASPHYFVAFTGSLAIVVMGFIAVGRTLLRAVQRSAPIPPSASPSSGAAVLVGPSGTREALDEKGVALWKIRHRQGPDFADWVAARVDVDVDASQITAYAEQWYPAWSDTQRDYTRTDESKAKHEAAHAVVAYALGCAVTEVTIIPKGEFGGHTSVHMPVPRVDLATQNYILMHILLAGRDIDLDNAIHDLGAENDMERLTRAAAAIISTGTRPDGHDGPLTTDTLIHTAATRTHDILTEHHHAVETITSTLIAIKTITSRQIRELLDRTNDG